LQFLLEEGRVCHGLPFVMLRYSSPEASLGNPLSDLS
jgi:hypothetical protein